MQTKLICSLKNMDYRLLMVKTKSNHMFWDDGLCIFLPTAEAVGCRWVPNNPERLD